MDGVNHADVRHRIQLRNIGDLRIPLYTATQPQLLFAIEPSIHGMGYRVTCTAHHHSVLSRIIMTVVSVSHIVSKYT